jgi:hypothetical protein
MKKLKKSLWIYSVINLMLIGILAIPAEIHADLKDGLVSVWRFDEGNGNAIHDSFGNNDGIIDGAEWVDGRFGLALDFNGVDAGVEIPDDPSLQLADALTVACWIYPRAVLNADGIDHAGVVWKGNMIGWGSDVYNFRIATAGAAGLTWGSCGSGTEGYFATANCFVNGLNTWYHVALVENGSEGRAYVNGVVMTDADVAGSGDMHRPRAPYDVWEGEPVRIGWSQGYNGDVNTLVYFDGIIDEVVIYDRALDAEEIEELMENGAPGGRIPTQPEKPEEQGGPSGSLATTHGAVKDHAVVYVEEQSVDVNSTFNVDIRVSNVKNLAGFQISLDYEPYNLQFVRAQEGNALSQNGGISFWRNPEVDAEAGTIVGAASTRTTAGGVNVEDDILMTLTFEAKELGRTMLTLQEVRLSDSKSQFIPILMTSAFITISPPWDVITDSVIDIRDMVAVGQNLSNSDLAPILAAQTLSIPDTDEYNPDVDRNGVVNIDDLIIVSSHLGEAYSVSDASQNLIPIAELRKAYNLVNAAPGDSPDVRMLKAYLLKRITSVRATSAPAESWLFPNYPNPFNPGTWIPYQLARPGDVTISIYNVSGHLLRTINLGHKEAGRYMSRDRAVNWDGRDDRGGELASGVYFYLLKAGEFTSTRKMILEK